MRDYLRAAQLREQPACAGFDDNDFADGGSDRLVDAIVAWGDRGRDLARVRAHLDAGADHVCIQALAETSGELLEHLRILAQSDVVSS